MVSLKHPHLNINIEARVISRPRQLSAAFCVLAAALLVPMSGFAQEAAPTQPAAPEQPPAEAPPAATDEASLTAEQRAAYDQHLLDGKQAYAKQDFEGAFQALNKAYQIHNKPSILFNLALISEKSGALERAAEHYQKYLEAPGVTLQNRQRASERLAAVQQILATSESAEEAREKQQMTDLLPALEAMGIESAVTETGGTDTTQTTTAQTGDTGTTTTTSDTTTTTTTTPDATAGATAPPPEVEYKWPVYAAFGTATAALAGGVVMVALTNKAIDDGKAAGLAGDTAGLASKEEDASMYASTAAGLFIGGAALAVVGSYFVVRSSAKAEQEAAAAGGEDTSASLSFSLHKDFLGPIFSLKF